MSNTTDLQDFFEIEFPDGVKIMTPQFDRLEPLDFQWKPSNYHEFITTVKNAPWEVLKGFGFGKWDKISSVVTENQSKKGRGMTSIPCINGPDLLVDLEPKENAPMEQPEVDEWIILFPYEWYDIIPDGFMVTGLSGEQYPFEKGKSDDDKRFGCLAYGIRRVITDQSPTP
jgi:hypothetical protein